MRHLALLLLITLSACKPISTPPSTTKLILRAELREIHSDLIREFRFFENATVEETITYSSNNKLFETKFYKLNPNQLKNLQTQISELSSKPHQNEFPWQEDFYERGDVVKFEYAGKDGLPYCVYYYTGHKNTETVFKQIYQIILNHSSESLFKPKSNLLQP